VQSALLRNVIKSGLCHGRSETSESEKPRGDCGEDGSGKGGDEGHFVCGVFVLNKAKIVRTFIPQNKIEEKFNATPDRTGTPART
jgi:hypothetical protein